jgi:hypothetical protein
VDEGRVATRLPTLRRARGERNEGAQSFGKVLEVLGETPVPPEPAEGALNHPSPGQDDETAPAARSFAARMSVLRGLPPSDAMGISGSNRIHSASLRSLG